MRISHLSRQSGMSIATIKFYLREQLLPPGTLTARNQAEYDESHLERLRLIRVLTGVGMMSLASVREVLAAIDSNCTSPHRLAKVINRALHAEHPVHVEGDLVASARARVDDFLDQIGWRVDADAPGRSTLAQVLIALQGLGYSGDPAVLAPYAEAAERLAARELDTMPTDEAATIVAGTVLFEVAFAVIRRMAHEHCLELRANPASSTTR